MARVAVFAAWCGVCLTWSTSAQADERILSFHSDIVVHEDGSLRVTETIRVRAEGVNIKRGIYRDFPTRYKDRFGNNVVVGFDVLKVLRDGQPEAYHEESERNGVRVYVGRKDFILPHGEYTYAITYRTNRQLGFFEEHDELYFNVTGNGWAFPIDVASASIALPEGVPSDEVRVEGYTGPQGSKATDLTGTVDNWGRAQFKTIQPLGKQEGLTIVTMWPKGFVRAPTAEEELQFFMRDNELAVIAGFGLLALFIYYLIAWILVGRDPAKGTIIPRFHPPDGTSPAAARFVMRMAYDNKCFAAALIHLGVKGKVRLEEEDDEYTVHLEDSSTEGLSRGEQVILKTLLGHRSAIVLKQSNHSTIGEALRKFTKALREEYEVEYFLTNSKYLLIGVLLIVATAGAVIMKAGAGEDLVFLGVWLGIWTLGVLALMYAATTSWRSVIGGGGGIGRALFLTIFSLPFVGAEVGVIFIFAKQTSPLATLALIAMFPLSALFYQLLKAPTRSGRKLMDETEGFRMYLSVAERDRLSMMKSPEKTPELFEAYLPYALALDVEQEWAEQFAGILDSAAAEQASSTYRPHWYAGRALTAGALAGAVGGALSSAIASSSTAPGSGGSGGGGGGSSGGGGGGGGGGGW